jgi:hypothetical protein
MRRLALAILILLAGPGFALAACEPIFGVGNYVACAISAEDGSIECWGTDTFSLLTSKPSVTGATFIDGGDDTVCYITSTGAIDCWGCGGCSVTDDVPAGTNYVSVSPGTADEACALETDDTITCWGDNVAFFDVAPPASTFDQMSGDQGTFCGVLTTGALECWGFDLATGVMTEPAGTDYAKVDATGSHACALKDDASIACWGDNSDGQTTVPGTGYIDVAVSDGSSCAVESDNDLVCWGSDVLDLITDIPAGDFVAVKCSTGTCCASSTTGNISCWGDANADIVTGSAGEECPAAPAPGGGYIVTFVGDAR